MARGGLSSLSLRRFDGVLAGLALALCALGLLLIISATASEPALAGIPLRQGIWVAAGLLALLFVAALDPQGLAEMGYFVYWATVFLLVLVLVTARKSAYGGAGWLNLRWFYLQPSELAKVTAILALTRYLANNQAEVQTWKGVFKALGITAGLQVLILLEPDLGTALVLMPITFAMLMVAGARRGHLLSLGAIALSAGPLTWPFLREYQRNRILTFLNPEMDALGAGYNAIQSQIAVGSGGWFGQGYLRGTQSQLHFVPFHHTDFVFSVLGEEFGLVGCLLGLFLLLALLARVADTGLKARSLTGSLICTGVATWLAVQSFVNIGMNIGIVPVTGIPLPLLSYGGSSTLAAFFGLGLVLSVRRDG